MRLLRSEWASLDAEKKRERQKKLESLLKDWQQDCEQEMKQINEAPSPYPQRKRRRRRGASENSGKESPETARPKVKQEIDADSSDGDLYNDKFPKRGPDRRESLDSAGLSNSVVGSNPPGGKDDDSERLSVTNKSQSLAGGAKDCSRLAYSIVSNHSVASHMQTGSRSTKSIALFQEVLVKLLPELSGSCFPCMTVLLHVRDVRRGDLAYYRVAS